MTLKNSQIAGGLVKAINDIENPKKTEATDDWGNTFSYASLDEVVKVIKKALSKEGLAVLQPPAKVMYEVLPNGFEQGIATVTTQIVHESGEVLEFDPITFKANGNTPQMVGSAITYGRRYSLMSIFGIAGEDDDDGRSASLHGANTGSSTSVPENPNKNIQEENPDNTNGVVDEALINDEQRQELTQLATEFAQLRNATVEGVIGAFGGLEGLTSDRFEPTKSKLVGWIAKANAESQSEIEKEKEAVESKEDEPKIEKEKEDVTPKTNDRGATKGSSIFKVNGIENKVTTEGTEYIEVKVENTKTPMIAMPEVTKNLQVGMEFLGYYTKQGKKVTLEKVEDVADTQTSLI